MQFSFSYQKAIQALNYFALKEGGEMNKMKALKLVYFADRYHLRKYGRPITNDTYFALPYGPVASACLNLLNAGEFETSESKYRDTYLEKLSHYTYSSNAAVESEHFSETDQEALQYAWDTYRNQDQFQLAEKTHEFPEWKKHAAALNSGQVGRRPMPYSDFLENPESGVEDLLPLSVEEQQDLKEEISELHAIESVWN